MTALFLTTSCGNMLKKSSGDFSPTSQRRSPTPAPGDIELEEPTFGKPGRLCTQVIENLSVEQLESFFNEDIQNLEGPATFCFFKSETTSYNPYTFRIEYEDDSGVHSYSTDDLSSKAVFFTVENDSTDFLIQIYDIMGFVQLEGSIDSNNKVDADIFFANMPSYNTSSNQAPYLSWDECVEDTTGSAKLANGNNCTESANFPRNLWEEGTTALTTLEKENLSTMIDQYTQTAFPNAFQSLNIASGKIGSILIDQ